MISPIRWTVKIFVLPIIGLWFAAGIAFAEGAAGVRGGGTGTICEPGTIPVTLEEYQIEQSHQSFTIPENREEIPAWLDHQFKGSPELLKSIKATWKNLKSFDSWPLDEHPTYSDTHEIEFYRQVSTIFDDLKVAVNKDIPFSLMHDDFLDLPPECQKVQLSILQNSKVVRIYSGTISERTKRFLELHEAIYLMGMLDYRQFLPRPTRDLIVALNSQQASWMKKSFKAFAAQTNTSFNHIFLLNGSINSGMKEAKNCPFAVSVVFDGEKFQTVALEHEAAGNLIVVRQSLPLPEDLKSLNDSHAFVSESSDNDKSPNGRGTIETFGRSTDSEVIYSLIEGSEKFYWGSGQGISTPRYQALGPNPAACTYVVWDYTLLLSGNDLNEMTKVWNSLLLSQSFNPNTSSSEKELK